MKEALELIAAGLTAVAALFLFLMVMAALIKALIT